MSKVLCIVAGKSGGHIIPGILYAKQYTERHPEYKVLFFSTDTELDRSIVALYPYTFDYIPLKLMAIPGKKVWRYPLFFWQLSGAFLKSLKYLRQTRPDRVVSMGGYISIPVCLVAFVLRIPRELFELNVVPGKAIEWLAPLARKIYICFEGAAQYFKSRKTEVVSYPLRFNEKDKVPQSAGRLTLGLNQQKKTILVLGGSQGSRWINDFMIAFCKAHPEVIKNIQIIHQTGFHGKKMLETFYQQQGIEALVFDYSHELQYCYAAADLVVARAGAGTLFELLFFEKKSLIIPLETATTAHQVDNAQAMVEKRPDLFVMARQHEIEKDRERWYRQILACTDSQ